MRERTNPFEHWKQRRDPKFIMVSSYYWPQLQSILQLAQFLDLDIEMSPVAIGYAFDLLIAVDDERELENYRNIFYLAERDGFLNYPKSPIPAY